MSDSKIPFPELTIDENHSLNPYEKSVLLHLLASVEPKVILELGVFKGITTKFIYQWLKQYKIEAKIIGFDLEDVLTDLLKNDREIARIQTEGSLKLVGGYLPESLDLFLKNYSGKVDFALIDAKHDYPSVYGELSRIWPYLSDKGCIICHDYHKPRIQYAIENFSRKRGAQYISVLATPQAGPVYSSLAIIKRPALNFNRWHWLIYHFEIKNWKGYYWFKRNFPKYFRGID